MTYVEGFRGAGRALHGDRQGAIFWIGIFMCCILASLIWYLLGIGQAILWRDRGQEIADSIALTSASCHARGMNMISFLNLLMLLVTAVFVVFKLIDLLLAFFAVAVFSWVPGTQSLAMPTWQLHDKLARGLSKYEKMMERTFPVIGRGQIWVAHGAPIWGLASSVAVSKKYGFLDNWGFPVSLSMADTDWLTRFQKARPNKPPSEPKWPGDPPPGGGQAARDWSDEAVQYGDDNAKYRQIQNDNRGTFRQFALPQDFMGRLGLPVTADKFNFLCTSALAVGPNIGLQWMTENISFMKGALDHPLSRNMVQTFLRLTTYKLKEIACPGPFWKSGQYTPPDPKDLQDTTELNTNPECTDQAIDDRLRDQVIAGGPPRPGREPPQPGSRPDDDADAAAQARWEASVRAYSDWLSKKKQHEDFHNREKVKERRQKVKDDCEKFGKKWTQDQVIAAQIKNRDRGPKLMVPYAMNGNDWMQVWSFVKAAPPDDGEVRHMLQVVPKIMRRAVSDDPPVEPASHWYFAQAEFYLDCHERWFASCNFGSLATFKMAWRARLRRVKEPSYVSDIVMMILGSVVSSDWTRDRVAQVLPTKSPNFLKNWGSNFLFGMVKTNVLYESSLLSGHGEYNPNVLH